MGAKEPGSRLSGKTYGMFDVKWLHFGSATVFSAGSAHCGAAPNMSALIIGRVIAGGAGMYLDMLNLIAIDHVPAYMGGTGVIGEMRTILGPVIGGAFADSSTTWRWAFCLNLVVCGALSPAFFFIPSFQPQSATPTLTEFEQLDWVGPLIAALAENVLMGFYRVWSLPENIHVTR